MENAYQWSSDRGLAIVKVAIVSIEYDANTRELLKTVQRADALTGSRGNANLQASVARASSRLASTAVPRAWWASAWRRAWSAVGGLQQPVRRRRRPRTIRSPS